MTEPLHHVHGVPVFAVAGKADVPDQHRASFSVEVPTNVAEIGASAFDGCTGLTSIQLPDTLTAIGSSAFEGCGAVASIMQPDGRAFSGTIAGISGENLPVLQTHPKVLQWENNRNRYVPIHSHPLKQSRRMRSETLHFVDHPYFGILISVKSFDYAAEELDIPSDNSD